MRSIQLSLLLLLCTFVLQAQKSHFEGVLEYTYFIKHDQEYLKKTLDGFRKLGTSERKLRFFYADSMHQRFYIKQDSLWEEVYLNDDTTIHSISFQAGFFLETIDPITGQRVILSNEKKIEEEFNKLERNKDSPYSQDKINVSSWFRRDYSSLEKISRHREVIQTLTCQVYSLPSSIPGYDPTFYWITDEVKAGVAQLIPYTFNSIFTPKGLIVKRESEVKGNKYQTILRKITPGPIAPILPRLRSIDFGTLDSLQYADQRFNQHLAGKKIEEAPRMPDFSFYPVGSNQLQNLHSRLDSGKFVLIDLWGTWCGPCLRELPHLQAFQAEQAALLEVISLNLGDHRADYVQQIMAKNKMSGTQGYAGNLLQAFLNPGKSIPHAILLDPNMKILWRGNPAGNWAKLAALVRGN